MENRIYFKKETYEEYLKIKSNTDTICEYVNGIVSPKNKSIIIYSLDENGHYDIFENKTIASESISSSVFSDLKINMKDIFE